MKSPSVRVEYPEWVDPENVYVALCGDAENSFWLDAGDDAVQGWSWVGVGLPGRDHDAPPRVHIDPGAGSASGPTVDGWVGWMDYDSAARGAGVPAHIEAPGGRGMRVDWCIGFDHAREAVVLIAAPTRIDAVMAAVARVAVAPPVAPAPRLEAVARHRPDAYVRAIAACRRAIREGEAYQLCLTTRFEVATRADAVAVFRRLRAATGSHHAGLIRAGEVALASASPERFLEIDRGRVTTHPIKGTRPRHGDPVADRAAADELRASGKERAENVMIVDLMRNDLSRVCQPGSVRVPRLLAVESYPAVHQLVSTVTGRLRVGASTTDVLAATFPAGSMTGAPKVAAMTILHGLERGPRGVFAGCFGWVGENGAADLAMVIRSVLVEPHRAVVGAGGGITWRSVPEAEVAEVAVKARAPLAAVGAELPEAWRRAGPA
ncbi:anthranilate synthase component I family protein [Microbacterium aquimaris]|uniref:anthranilate synthase component I family protein n=1 Tax=Microbacterium aquimaris TaxID=459816 RepID=UPI002AD55448|nr:anthranilate synthase component I family protein [Microbacterium aquimaris]MDZ8275913.1 anthranilate synthase component I family protein [Microbacterium aquimaris]